MTPDRDFIASLGRMMDHAIARDPHNHTAQVIAREIAEHLATFPSPDPADAPERPLATTAAGQ